MKTYKFKLYNSKRNKHLHDQIDLACEIYNHCIALHKRYYQMYGKKFSAYTLMNHLSKLKRLPKYSHWYQLDARAIGDIAKRIDLGYSRFFRDLIKGLKTRPPEFKRQEDYTSFTLRAETGYKLLNENKIRIRCRIYSYFKSREIEGRVRTLTIKRDQLGDIYICCTATSRIPQTQVSLDSVVGFDWGMKTFLVGSDGTVINSPEYLKESLGDLRKANQEVSSKIFGSGNYKRAQLSLARIEKKIANRRRDFQFKLANQLTDKYNVMIFEDLEMSGMRKRWGRKMRDVAFSGFLQILEHSAKSKGKKVIYVDPRNTTKICSKCGYINQDLTLSDRSWLCPECGSEWDRDQNASYNILKRGLSLIEERM